MLEQDYDIYTTEAYNDYSFEYYRPITNKRSHYFEYDDIEGEIYNDEYGYEN